MQFWIHKNNNL